MPIDVYPSSLQPRNCASRVQDRLTADLSRSSDVRADDVVRARELGRHSDIVIRKAQAQRADPEAIEQTAQPDVALGIGIPLREHDDGAAPAALGWIGEVARAHQIVVGMRRVNRARERQDAIDERVVVGGRDVVKALADLRGLLAPRLQKACGIKPLVGLGNGRMVGQPVQSPLEWSDGSVRGRGGEATFPGMKGPRDHA